MRERDLQSACNKILRQLGVMYFHAEQGRGFSARHQHRAGWPDLFIFPKSGKVFFVELKVGRGKLSPVQLQMRERLSLKGYEVLEARTVAEFSAILQHRVDFVR